MSKDPWFKFYPTDWDSDVKLQSCSLAAQGLLIKLMCMMHQSPKPGYLLIGSSAPTWAQVGRVGRVPHNTLCKYLNELLENGVLVEEDGVLVCQRMVRDQAYRESQAEHGKKGGNPKLTGKTHKGSLIPRSQKSEARKRHTTTVRVFSLPDWMPEDAWKLFLDHRKKVKAPVSEKAYPSFVEKFHKLKDAGWPPDKVVDTIVEKGWRWFKPEWMKDQPNNLPPPPDTTGEERRALEKAREENPDEWVGPEEMARIRAKFGFDFGKRVTTGTSG